MLVVSTSAAKRPTDLSLGQMLVQAPRIPSVMTGTGVF